MGNVTMVDIDEGLVQFCATHLSAMHRGSFNSSRVSLIFEDGAAFVKRTPPELFDVVIVDGVDFDEGGASTGNVLFGEEFYYDLHKILRPRGVLVQYMSDANRAAELRLAGFLQTLDLGVDIPSFLGEGARFTVASKNPHPPLVETISQQLTKEDPKHSWRYLNLTTFGESTAHTARRLKGGGYYSSGHYSYGHVYYYGGDSAGGVFFWVVFFFVLMILAMIICTYYKRIKETSGPAQIEPFLGAPGTRVQQRSQAPMTEDMDFCQLNVEQQLAAQALGYTQAMWDNDLESQETSARNAKNWFELQPWEQQNMLCLGWTPVSWQHN